MSSKSKVNRKREDLWKYVKQEAGSRTVYNGNREQGQGQGAETIEKDLGVESKAQCTGRME